MPYELLEHTADAKFHAWGDTLEEAFASAIEATCAIATDPTAVERKKHVDIEVHASDKESLLFDLIAELIYLIDTQGFLASHVKTLTIAGDTLHARLEGDDAKKYGCNLKAPTYSEMEVVERAGRWHLQAVVDI